MPANSEKPKRTRKKSGKSDENIIRNHINGKKKEVCRLIDALLDEIGSPERISGAPLNQLTSVVGTLIDKFGADEKITAADGGELQRLFEDFKDVK